jgi:hypothetical protein
MQPPDVLLAVAWIKPIHLVDGSRPLQLASGVRRVEKRVSIRAPVLRPEFLVCHLFIQENPQRVGHGAFAAVGRLIENFNPACRRIAHGHHRAAATVQIQGFLAAEADHLRRKLMVAHAEGDAGFASMHATNKTDLVQKMSPPEVKQAAYGETRAANIKKDYEKQN